MNRSRKKERKKERIIKMNRNVERTVKKERKKRIIMMDRSRKK